MKFNHYFKTGLCTPYGEIVRSYNNADANDKYKFTEKERDKETNLDYFGARYYDAGIGRWLAVDPLAIKYPGWNPYNYVLSNPIILFDPNGMIVKPDGDDEQDLIDDAMQNQHFARQYKQLHSSKEIYRVKIGSASTGGKTIFNGKEFEIIVDPGSNFETSKITRLSHEFEHGAQWERGELAYFTNDGLNWQPTSYDMTDEIGAFNSSLKVSEQSDKIDNQGHFTRFGKFAASNDKESFLRKEYGYNLDSGPNNNIEHYGNNGLPNDFTQALLTVRNNVTNWGLKYKPYWGGK